MRFFLLFLAPLPLFAEPFTDPAPPIVSDVTETTSLTAFDYEELTFHREPKPLSKSAITSDWPRYLGPSDDVTTSETPLLEKFPEGGPTLIWERKKGDGYTSPVIAEGKLVFFHRIGAEEVTECLDPLNGKRFWKTAYPVSYRDRYGFSSGPRCSAIIDSGKVYTYGVQGVLTCLDLSNGAQLWQRDLKSEFEAGDYFFGYGACPLIYEGMIIVNLGANVPEKLAVVAFDQHTGALQWGTPHEWRASYASPIIGELQGEPTLLVMAGGESSPPTGGILAINPKTGELFDAFPWRSEKRESVNGQTPVLLGDNRVYISDAYDRGGICLELSADKKWQEVWRAPEFGFHWTMPVLDDGYLYGFRGRNEPDAWLACYDVETGKEQWRQIPEWTREDGGRDFRLQYFRGNLLQADGRAYVLGEIGDLGVGFLTPNGYEESDRASLFFARSTWSPIIVSQGLLYITQHEDDMATGTGPRLLCYDLRGGSE